MYLRTFLCHGDVQLLLLLATAVVMSNREVSAIPSLGGRSLGQARLTNQALMKTATSPLPYLLPHQTSLHQLVCRLASQSILASLQFQLMQTVLDSLPGFLPEP